ncbi:LCP family protein [Deinococcus ruber]|uniref:LytR family transcriptional regulator n=1 Tax=Deinococcus ruber TaxID=1848197 RepID=A0A918FBA6_9DEIO|nr:LCP family protein [Deinococcus ruber]GGR27135.1 LytR family transcriptional regulator [Deinococcus ruber]
MTPEYAGYHQQAPETFNGLTDSMVVVQLDPAASVVRLLSLPRDTQVTLSGLGVHKLNAALPLLGPDGLVRTVASVTGLDIRGYLLINLNAARDLTDALGGVTLFVPKDMNYEDRAAGLQIHLKRGLQRLNGMQAEGFLRFRHDALGDIGRTQRQQQYLQAIAKVLLSPGVLPRLPAISDVLTRDTRMNLTQVDISGALALMLQRPALTTSLLPGRFLTQDGVSYWQINPANLREVLANFGRPAVGASGVPTPRTSLSIALLKAGASDETLGQLRQRLLRVGYRQVTISADQVSPVPTTAVLSNSTLGTAQAVLNDLQLPGRAAVSGEGVLWANVTVWVGTDARRRPMQTSPDAGRGMAPVSVH